MVQLGPADESGLSWRVARACNGGACLRVASKGEIVVIGDSKDLDGPVLRYTRSAWDVFIAGIKQGDFDII